MALIKAPQSQPVNEDERRHARTARDLMADLAAADAATRRWAARDLAAFPEAVAVLVARLKVEAEVSVREVILTTLTRLGDDLAIAGLVDCLRSEDAALRNEALEAMKQLPEEVAPIMRGLLRDGDPDVRIFAVNILESLRHPEVEAWLIDVIAHDAHVNVCATALDLLGEVGTEAAEGPLRALTARFPGEPYIQFAASLALGRIHEG